MTFILTGKTEQPRDRPISLLIGLPNFHISFLALNPDFCGQIPATDRLRSGPADQSWRVKTGASLFMLFKIFFCILRYGMCDFGGNLSSFEKGHEILLCEHLNKESCCSCLVHRHADLIFCNNDRVYVKLTVHIQKRLFLVYGLPRKFEMRCNCSLT